MSAGSTSSAASISQPASASPNDPSRIRGDALRRSLYYNFLTWIPANCFLVATTGVAAVELARHLGATDRIFGLLAAAPLFATLAQLPGSLAVERFRNRRMIYISTVLVFRVTYIVIGLLPWFVPKQVAWPAMLMAGLVFFGTSMFNFGIQAWVNWVADLVPTRIHGNYFARCYRLGVCVNAVAGVGVALALDLAGKAWFEDWMTPVTRWAGLPPLIFIVSMVFIVGGLVGILDPLAFFKVDEAPLRSVPEESLLRRLAKPVRDKVFLRYMAYWCLWNAAVGFCNWMWLLNVLDFFQRDKLTGAHHWWHQWNYLATTLILPVAYAIGQFIGYPMWGRAVDRFGRKPVLFISSTLNTANWFSWIFISPALIPWLFLLQLTGGIVGGGQDIASFNMMLHFNRRGGPGYQAFGAIAFNFAGGLGALAASNISGILQARNWQWTFAPGTAWEHTFTRYAAIIAIGAALKYTADFFLLPLVKDTGDKPTAHAFRFVLANVYGSINSLIIAPLRTGVHLTDRVRRWWR